MINNQKQQSGDNSTQIIAHNITIGIDEKRAREIYDEKYEIAKAQFTSEAIEIANSRIREFEDKLVSKMKKIDGALQSFGDPSTQLLIIEAQKSAAQSERKCDYELLSELLVHKHLNKSNRETISGINRAVKIVHEISSEALLALTVMHVIEKISPVAGDPSTGIEALNGIFSKIIDSNLPTGVEWIEHAELLGAVRVIPFQSGLLPLAQIFKNKFNGYVCTGIKLNSIEHEKALRLLDSNGIPRDILVENTINPGYVRLNVPHKDSINEIIITQFGYGGPRSAPISVPQRSALGEILSLYNNDAAALENSVKSFAEEWDKRPALKKISEWWSRINVGFCLTKVGTVLSHANAQRCDSGIPNLQ